MEPSHGNEYEVNYLAIITKKKNQDDNWSVSVKLASQEICIGQQSQSNKGYELVMSHRTTPQLE